MSARTPPARHRRRRVRAARAAGKLLVPMPWHEAELAFLARFDMLGGVR